MSLRPPLWRRNDAAGESEFGLVATGLMAPDQFADGTAHHPGDGDILAPGDLAQNDVILRIQAYGETSRLAVSTGACHGSDANCTTLQ